MEEEIDYHARGLHAYRTRQYHDYKLARWSLWKRLKAQMITWEQYWVERKELDASYPEQATIVNKEQKSPPRR